MIMIMIMIIIIIIIIIYYYYPSKISFTFGLSWSFYDKIFKGSHLNTIELLSTP